MEELDMQAWNRLGTGVVTALALCALAAGCRQEAPGENEAQPDVSPQANSGLPDTPAPPGSPAGDLQSGAEPGQPQAGVQPSPGVEPPQEGGTAVAMSGPSDARSAVAEMMPMPGHMTHGRVEFIERAGELEIVADFDGLPPGDHGFHVHEGSDCAEPGEHFAPDGDPHGAPTDAADAHHAGDLGNVSADDVGRGQSTLRDDELSLQGEYGLVGRVVVVHSSADDLHSQPSGNSGDPIACGIVELSQDQTPPDQGQTGPG
jgi:Cu-Zn family superoxide dismutase